MIIAPYKNRRPLAGKLIGFTKTDDR
ncbi:protein of unknown function [Lactiplantibacillus plantarum]